MRGNILFPLLLIISSVQFCSRCLYSITLSFSFLFSIFLFYKLAVQCLKQCLLWLFIEVYHAIQVVYLFVRNIDKIVKDTFKSTVE